MADVVVNVTKQALRDSEIKGALDSPNWAPFNSLMEMRELCAAGAMYNVKADMDAKGIGYPEVPAMCRAVAEGAGKRELSGALYLELALRDLHGGTIVGDADLALVSNGEHVQYLGAIVKSASKGDDKYTTLSGKIVPLRPELSYDAGFWLGQVKSDGIPALPPEVADSVANRCFSKEPAKSITINNQEIPATKACLIAGANFGKEVFLSKEKAELSTRPDGDLIDKKTKTGATRSIMGN